MKPFKTEAIKPYFDYPLNTGLLEQTLEFDLTAVLGTGTGSPVVPNGVIPVGAYGAIFAVFPHSYNDL